MHPQLEQDERDQHRVKVSGRQMAMPEMIDRVGVEQIEAEDHDREHRRGRDQRLDADQLGAQHLLHQGMAELGRYRRALLALLAPKSCHLVTPVIPGHASAWTRNLNLRCAIAHRSSMPRITPE